MSNVTIDYKGAKYKMAEEYGNSQDGDLIYLGGSIFRVDYVNEKYAMVEGENVLHEHYRVLIPAETDMDELLEINANLIKRVFELEAGQRNLFAMLERDKPKLDDLLAKVTPENKHEELDNVNHPRHYNSGKYEVINVIEDSLKDGFEPYCIGNVMKYVSRYKHKNGVEDLKKAQWYLGRVIDSLGKERD
jgi:hypothetical protein